MRYKMYTYLYGLQVVNFFATSKKDADCLANKFAKYTKKPPVFIHVWEIKNDDLMFKELIKEHGEDLYKAQIEHMDILSRKHNLGGEE